jgi:hypothetical protein
MLLFNAISQVIGNPQLCAFRQGSAIIGVSDRNKVIVLNSKHLYRFTPKLADYMSSAWEVITLEKLRDMMASGEVVLSDDAKEEA